MFFAHFFCGRFLPPLSHVSPTRQHSGLAVPWRGMKLCLAPAGGVEIGACPPAYVPASPTRALRHQHIQGITFSKMKGILLHYYCCTIKMLFVRFLRFWKFWSKAASFSLIATPSSLPQAPSSSLALLRLARLSQVVQRGTKSCFGLSASLYIRNWFLEKYCTFRLNVYCKWKKKLKLALMPCSVKAGILRRGMVERYQVSVIKQLLLLNR